MGIAGHAGEVGGVNGQGEELRPAAGDQLYVELQLVARRLRRAESLLGAVALAEPETTAWGEVGRWCEAALSAVTTAAARVPDAPAEYVPIPRVLSIRALRLDPYARRVWFQGEELELANKEFALLGALALDPTRVHSKRELLTSVWEYAATPRTRTVDSHASRLRRKLVAGGAAPEEWVINEWGVGYALLRSLTPNGSPEGS